MVGGSCAITALYARLASSAVPATSIVIPANSTAVRSSFPWRFRGRTRPQNFPLAGLDPPIHVFLPHGCRKKRRGWPGQARPRGYLWVDCRRQAHGMSLRGLGQRHIDAKIATLLLYIY